MIGNNSSIKAIGCQFVKFVSVGLVNTSLFTLVCLILRNVGCSYPVYTALGYFAGMCFSFYANFYFTFRYKKRKTLTMFKFVITCLCLLCLVENLQFFLIEIIGCNEFISILIAMAAYTLIGFVINRQWVFK